MQMERQLQLTADGSHTLYIPEMDEHYHSVNGAIQESSHIFIGAGLHSVEKEDIQLLEIGFGTGLNALLTWKEAELSGRFRHITYYAIERYPLPEEITSRLNYGERVWPERKSCFELLHRAEWNKPVDLSGCFTLHKIEGDSNTCPLPDNINLIYMDAFAPEKQPEMWNEAFYHKLYTHSVEGAVLVTYCAKGEVRRTMQSAGFDMERLPGPPGKRHILRGRKI